MLKKSVSRRGVFSGLSALLGGALVFRGASAAMRTPSAAEGPFYPTPAMRGADIDNDLVKIDGEVRAAGGEVIRIAGTLLDRAGKPFSNKRVEIWQCDWNGKYLHPGDNRDLVHDRGFQGFGHDITNGDGRFSFRTIMPVTYPGRTPHIHLKVLDGRRELLTSQLYIKGHPQNKRDFLYRSMSRDAAAGVSMAFVDRGDHQETSVTIVV
ncbi:MAG: protocatechuate 3,4-dioxygenase [Pseudomonadota bacterium]